MIRNTLKRLIQWANRYDDDSSMVIPTPQVKIGGRAIDSDNSMNFSLYSASGGYVVELKQYDRKTDRNNNQLHIINSDENLGERIGQIITLELLRA